MKRTDKWKTWMAYTAGMVLLAVSGIIAWFLPEWLGEWQDDRLMGQVTLSSRENIEFLNSDSLDKAGRLKMLGEAWTLSWNDYYEEYGYGFSEVMVDSDTVRRCKNVLDQWYECGLLPADCRDWIKTESGAMVKDLTLLVDNGVLPVDFLVFVRNPEESDGYLTDVVYMLMDASKDIIYYISMIGPETRKTMAEELGYASLGQLEEEMFNGQPQKEKEIDTSQFDFATVCSAESARILTKDGQLELTAVLEFENFQGYAGRKVFYFGERDYGLSVMLGTYKWEMLIEDLYEGMGLYVDYPGTNGWLESMKGIEKALDSDFYMTEKALDSDSYNGNERNK